MVKKVIFKILGMHCTSCAMNIDGDLEDSGKVKSSRTNYAKAQTEVEFDPGKISEEEIIQKIAKTGYTAEFHKD
jgi:Cu+-exporting ATPase